MVTAVERSEAPVIDNRSENLQHWRGRRRRPSAASHGVAVDDRRIAPGWD